MTWPAGLESTAGLPLGTLLRDLAGRPGAYCCGCWVHFCVTWAAGLESSAGLLPGTLLRDLAGWPGAYCCGCWVHFCVTWAAGLEPIRVCCGGGGGGGWAAGGAGKLRTAFYKGCGKKYKKI